MEQFICPHCDKEIEGVYEEEEQEPNPLLFLKVDMNELVDHIFTELVQMGVSPKSEHIFDVIMMYQDYMDKKLQEQLEE